MAIVKVPTSFDFIHALFDGLDGFIEFRLIGIGKTSQHFFDVAQVILGWQEVLAKLQRINKTNGVNVYFGVNPRTDKVGDAAHVKTCRNLWADIDTKDPAIIKRNCDVLKPLGLYPSAIIDSGHGYHLYWFLKEEIDPAEAEKIMREIARVVGGDHTYDSPRILRLPETLNVKSVPVPCKILHLETKRYNASDFEPLSTCGDGINPKRKVAAPAPRRTPEAIHSENKIAATVHGVAEAVLPWWKEGVRHKLAMGLAGLLKRDGIPELEALAIIKKVSEESKDPEIEDRLKAVKTTYRQETVAGVSLVQEVLGDEAQAFLKAYNEAVRAIPAAPCTRYTMPPFELYDCVPPGGIFDCYTMAAATLTDAPWQYHVGSILTVAASALGNKAWVRYYGKKLFATLYTLITGPSSRYRKSSSINISKDVLKRAKVKIYPNNTTVEQMYAKMADVEVEWKEEKAGRDGIPKRVAVAWRGRPQGIIIHNEFTSFLEASSKSYMADARSMLMNFYDGFSDEGRETKTQGKHYVDDPAVSMLCGVTPTAIRTFCGKNDMGSGFLARFLVLMPPMEHENKFGLPEPDFLLLDDVMTNVSRRLESVNVFQAGEVKVQKEANEVLVKFERFLNEKIRAIEGTDKAALDPFFSRLGAMAVKLAMVHAVCELEFTGPVSQIEITAKHMTYGTNFCTWSARCLEFFFEEVNPDNGNREYKWRNQVLSAARGIVKKHGNKPIPHRMLFNFSNLDADQFKRAIESLRQGEQILKGPAGAKGGATYLLNEVEVQG